MPARFLSPSLILAIHRDQIQRFGGTPGIRDAGLLESAIAQPMATSKGRLLHRTVRDQAAAYLFHLCANHPFVDGNKRVAFAAMDVFLRVNGWRLTMTDDEAYDMTIAVASGSMTKRAIAQRLRDATEPVRGR